MLPTAFTVQGHTITLTNLDKVLYPDLGFQKVQVIDYYLRIAPVLLPALRDRALTLKRYPDGADRPHFYEKHAPSHRPAWVSTVVVHELEYLKIDSLAALVWLANLAALEIHVPLAYASKPDEPASIVFDLDPGEPADVLDCAMVALRLRQKLISDGLNPFVKSSGQKGMQLYCDLESHRSRFQTFDDTKRYSKQLAEALAKETPKAVVADVAKDRRGGKVYIDWMQNDAKKTTVCVYSLRATTAPQVSAPLLWTEVEDAVRLRTRYPLYLSPKETIARMATVPWLKSASDAPNHSVNAVSQSPDAPPRRARSKPKSKD